MSARARAADGAPPLKRAKTEAHDTRVQIRFFQGTKEGPGFLSNFFEPRKPLTYKHKTYRTAEHLYQAMKFMQDPDNRANRALAESIRQQTTPYKAKILAGSGGGNRKWQQNLKSSHARFVSGGAKISEDWLARRLGVMRKVVDIKFANDVDCAKALRATGNAELIEASPYDAFWGTGRDGRGHNWLGKILEETRERLLAED